MTDNDHHILLGYSGLVWSVFLPLWILDEHLGSGISGVWTAISMTDNDYHRLLGYPGLIWSVFLPLWILEEHLGRGISGSWTAIYMSTI